MYPCYIPKTIYLKFLRKERILDEADLSLLLPWIKIMDI